MKIIKEKSKKLRINSNIKIIIIMTFIIILLMILLPVIFLRENKKNNNISSFDLNDDNIVKSSSLLFPLDGRVKLYHRQDDSVEEIDLEEYIMGVVASEMPANFDEEALKAQAVAARTYYMNKRINPCKDAESKGAEICDSTNCQVYMNKETRLSTWSKKDGQANWDKIKKAVEDTKGEVLTYDGQVLKYPQFFATSSGRTEDAEDVLAMSVPYLKSTESNGEEIAPKYETSVSISVNDFINKLKAKYRDIDISADNIKNDIKIQSHTEGGGVKEINIGNITISGVDFRSILNLNSTNFNLSYKDGKVIIECKGYGHGVGMSQWGANVMAKNGSSYDKILEHYYKGIEIEKIKYE